MHILYFHQHFSTPDGSGGTRSYEMAHRLVAEGHKVTMVCGSYAQGQTGLTEPFHKAKRSGTYNGIDIVELELGYSNYDGLLKRTWTFLLFAIRSIYIAIMHPADIVFATSTPLTAALPGIAAKWIRRRIFVFEVRDLWPELPKAMGVITNPVILGAMGLLEKIAYKSADRLIGLSPGIVDGIAKHGVDRDKIALIPNGCDIELFSTPTQKWRPEGVEPDDFMAIFTGTHGKANGLSAIIDAAICLKDRNVEKIKLVLVGDGKEKPDLIEQVRLRDLGDYIIFHDPVPKRQLVGLMQSADLGLQILANVPAFYYGTSPNKFFDYLAAGLPVLTNYPGWVADLVSEHECGVVIAPNDANAFADALVAMKRADAANVAHNSLDLAQQRFSRNRLSEDFIVWINICIKHNA